MQASIAVEEGQPGHSFDCSHALLITGTAVIQVRTGDTLTLTASFTGTLTNVLPDTEAVFDETWDTTGVDEGQYNILGYVLYDGQATAPKSVRVGGGGVVYLPLVLRQAQ